MKIKRSTALILLISVLFAVLTVGVFIGRSMNRRFLYAGEVQQLAETKNALPKLNINTATAAQLAELEGVDDALAERIVAYRVDWGTYDSLQRLLSVDGFSRELLEALGDRLTVG